MNTLKAAFALLIATTIPACTSYAHQDGAVTRRDRSVITRTQLDENHFQSAYDAVASLHANWLTVRGTDSFRTPSQVWVYQDAIRLGGTETLKAISTKPVSYIQHVDGIDATTRWGVGHSAGVILVSTHPVTTAAASNR